MIHYLAASLRRQGPPVSEVPVVVTVGEDCEPFDLEARNPWSRRYPLRWVWLNRGLFRRLSFYGTAVERYRQDFHASCVLMLDADVLLLRDPSSLVEAVRDSAAVHGLVAHVSPFWNHSNPAGARKNAEWWSALYDAADLGAVDYACQHTGWGVMCDDPLYRRCPPYFNFGVVAGPAEAMRRIGETIHREMAHVDSVLDTPFKCQLALSLAVVRLALPWRELRLRDNFPNRDTFVRAFPRDAREVRILHYLGQEDAGFRKGVDMASVPAVRCFLGRSGLGLANGLLRDALGAIQPIVDSDLRA
jgi:hypothetical protein